jgi:predicted DNA-binding transcriptional regulator AlpA
MDRQQEKDRIARRTAYQRDLRQAERVRRAREAQASPWVSIAEFMRLTGRSRTTIDRWRKRRPAGFPVEYVSTGTPMFRRQDVEAWLESQPLW